jgi:hypothetical protein
VGTHTSGGSFHASPLQVDVPVPESGVKPGLHVCAHTLPYGAPALHTVKGTCVARVAVRAGHELLEKTCTSRSCSAKPAPLST